MKLIRCALVGLGRIGVTLEDDPLREKPASHWGAVSFNRQAVLCGAVEPEKDRVEEFLKREPGCPVFDNLNTMIDAVSPDIIHIASDTETHMSLLSAALDRNVPVVVCEKPLANSLEEAEAVLPLLDSSESSVLINHERRFSRDYREVRGLIREKAFGELLSINARLYMGKTRPVSKILYHDGTHMLDILRFLCDGDLEILHSTGRPHDKGGPLMVLARSGKTDIVLDISGGRDHLVFEMDLSFEKGRIRVGNGVYELWSSEESPYYSGFRSLKCSMSGWSGRTAYFSAMMNHAIELYRNPGRKSESSFRDGLEVMRLIDCILEPYGEAPVDSDD